MGLLAPALLLGFLAIAIPPVVHLFQRKRFDVIDWGAMQFLQLSQSSQRKRRLDQWLLMLLRMALIAVLVLAFAAPYTKVGGVGSSASQPQRDIVIVLDQSQSMAYQYQGQTAQQLLVEETSKFLSVVGPKDRIAIILAGNQPRWLVDHFSSDRALVRDSLRQLPPPQGGADFPKAVREASELFDRSSSTERHVVIFSDMQHQGWLDAKTRENWELFAASLPEQSLPRVWGKNVAATWPAVLPNRALSPLQTNRAVVAKGKEVAFRSELLQFGQMTAPPGTVRVEIDRKPVGEIRQFPGDVDGRKLLRHVARLSNPGSHVISFILDGDSLPQDNRQDFAFEVVPAIPVLVIDGSPIGATNKTSDFMRDALSPTIDREPAFRLKIVSAGNFEPTTLQQPIANLGPPQVVVLADIKRLVSSQVLALEEFISLGGGCLVTTGERAEAIFYNESLYRNGEGWLPAQLVEPVGKVDQLPDAFRIVANSLEGTPLELLRGDEPGGLVSTAYFPRVWHLQPPEKSFPLMVLNNRMPLMLQKRFGKGKVVQTAVPFDSSWRTNLTDLGDYVRLMHETIYLFTDVRQNELNIPAGQPIIFQPQGGQLPGPVTVSTPDGKQQRLPCDEWPFLYAETWQTGIYQLSTDIGDFRYYVVQSDPREANLTRCSTEELATLPTQWKSFQVQEGDDWQLGSTNSAPRTELGFLLLCGFIGLLMLELRFARKQSG
ncbi:MAG: BatA domain-containing protein [Zavarzinella sp.]